MDYRLDSEMLTDFIGTWLLRRLTVLCPPIVGRHHQLYLQMLEDPPEVDGVKAGR